MREATRLTLIEMIATWALRPLHKHHVLANAARV